MMKPLEYKGYLGSAELDAENEVLVGKLLFIRDTIGYSAHDVAGLKAAFQEAVEDYLAACAELGDAPELPCKGSFNVRIPPASHRAASVCAYAQGVSLNEFVSRAIDAACQRDSPPTVNVIEQHFTIVRGSGEPSFSGPVNIPTSGAIRVPFQH
jgi:predicted HicB family RNase H-like nuclease